MPSPTLDLDPAEPALAADRLLLTTLDAPGGRITVVHDASGVVRAAGYDAAVVDRLLRAYAARGVPSSRPEPAGAAESAPLADALRRYLAGETGALDAVAVAQPGGEYFQGVWRAMREVPPGGTVTYTELAAAAGRPAAVRAAASACARNLVAPFVPCHRIVRRDGTLGGYAYGLAVKEALLAHERSARS